VRLLITGASGFIGRHLCQSARDRGYDVVGTYLREEELRTRLPSPAGVEWRSLNMQNPAEVSGIVDDVRADGVVHLAAQAYAKKAWADPEDTFRTNVLGTITLYEALRRTPPPKGVLLASSGASYGIPKSLPIAEDVPLNPTNPYGVSKACQDMLSFQYASNFGLRILRARLFGTTGPGKTGDALNDFARQVAALERTGSGGTIAVGNLDTRRDISDIRDVTRALWTIFERGTPTEAVNVGAGQSYSIRDIVDHLAKIAKVPVSAQADPALMRPTDEPDNRADVRRLRALGYVSEYPIQRTIEDSLEYWRGADS
jgi:GDP-4-dehydro-6-deoxy-D-mannose reductase